MALPCSALYLAALVLVLAHHHQPRLLVAAAETNLTAGVAMKPPSYITSQSGVFAFGFRALDKSNPGKFLLATWFRSHDDDDDGDGQASSSFQLQSVVWFARQGSSPDAVIATSQSVLSATADGQLVLADNTDGGNRQLWRAGIPTPKLRSMLVLLDSGNLQFQGDGGGTENVLWQSFWYPRDTLVPGQSLVMDSPSSGKLISKRTDTEFGAGRFSMGVMCHRRSFLIRPTPARDPSGRPFGPDSVRLGRAMGSCPGLSWNAVAVRPTRGRILRPHPVRLIFKHKHLNSHGP